MNRSELPEALLAGALVIAASSATDAFEPRELVTFDESSAGRRSAFDLCSTPTSDLEKGSSAAISTRHHRWPGIRTRRLHLTSPLCRTCDRR